MSKLIASVRERASLSPDEVAAMYALFEAYYDCTSFALFAADLQEKSHVILFTDGTPDSAPQNRTSQDQCRGDSRVALVAQHEQYLSRKCNDSTDKKINSGTLSSEPLDSGPLCGFSTLTLLQLPDADWRVLFSGDTIIDHAHWGEQALALEFCRFAGQIKASRPDLPLYWFLISKGYRTYRYLHLFAREYWPGFAADEVENATALEAILHQVASSKFGDAWDRGAGLIRFPHSRGQLRADWAGVRENLRQRPEVAYFLNKNPRYAEGEELACITLLDESNLRSVARRAFVEGLHASI